MKATETDNTFQETTEYTLRHRLTGTTSDPQREQVQLQHIQPLQNSWKVWVIGSLIVLSGFTYASILFLDSYIDINSPKYGGDGSSGNGFSGASAGGSGGAGVSW